MSTWFVSDLHLDPRVPEITARFLGFLAGPARGARALYLLGDLFEAWLGDDDPEPAHRQVSAALAVLSGRGTLIAVMPGNRDFLLDTGFGEAAGAVLIEDPSLLWIGGERVLLSHGDGLCVDDPGYQRLRSLVRDPRIRKSCAALPLASRRRLAIEARAGSRAHLAAADRYITDVNQAAVESLLRAAGAATLIHGHTHRPAIHHFDLDGRPCTRITLGDWHHGAAVLHWVGGEYRLQPAPE